MSLALRYGLGLLTTQNPPALSGTVCDGRSRLLPTDLTEAPVSRLPVHFRNVQLKPDPIALKQIRETLSLYGLTVDGKAFDELHTLFTRDVSVVFANSLGRVASRDELSDKLKSYLTDVDTQHHQSVQTVEMLGPCAARSITYVIETRFALGGNPGSSATRHVQYRDVLVNTGKGWRIAQRSEEEMGHVLHTGLLP